MAGHSQFKNIMHRKGKQDKERSKLFAKLSRELTVAAKSGLPDPVQYATQLKGLDEATVKKVMRDNLANFLDLN